MRNAPANSICVVCDDDETLESNIEETLINAYNLHKGAVAITFSLIRKDRNKKYPDAGKQIGFKDCLRTNSLQITFLRDEIILRHISFDINMGSGTGNGGGEENKFLLDIRRSGGKMFYTPIPIATVNPNANGSQWFKGYTSQFFINLGWTSRRLMGFFLGHVYIIYFLITHYKLYKNDMSFFKAFKYMLTGVYKRVNQ